MPLHESAPSGKFLAWVIGTLFSAVTAFVLWSFASYSPQADARCLRSTQSLLGIFPPREVQASVLAREEPRVSSILAEVARLQPVLYPEWLVDDTRSGLAAAMTCYLQDADDFVYLSVEAVHDATWTAWLRLREQGITETYGEALRQVVRAAPEDSDLRTLENLRWSFDAYVKRRLSGATDDEAREAIAIINNPPPPPGDGP